MDLLQKDHQQLLKGVNCSFRRYLYDKIRWEDRLIGIFGSRGIGKTTLLLQSIKLRFGDSPKALYVNMDNFWFQTHSLTAFTRDFMLSGGRYLFLDDIYFYPNWMEELSLLLDAYAGLNVVFTTSSLTSEEEVKKDLRCKVACYQMYPMSFREFLSYESILNKEPIPLEDILANHHDLVKQINAEVNIVPIFRNYLEHGCYPFYWDDPDAFYSRLQGMLKDEICTDLPMVTQMTVTNAPRGRKLLMMSAESTPVRPKIVDITRKAGLLRQQGESFYHYFHNLEIMYLPSFQQEPSWAKNKVYMGNTNILIALFGDKDNRQLMCETFFMSQMRHLVDMEVLENGDIMVNKKYTFAVGDPLQDYDRIKHLPDTFAAIYGLPKSTFNRMPVWLLGFCY